MDPASSGPAFGLVAGEASGDNLGGPLIRALANRLPGARFFGVAGPRMAESGCEAWYPAEALAVMGLAEIVKHLPRLLRLRRELLERLGRLRDRMPTSASTLRNSTLCLVRFLEASP